MLCKSTISKERYIDRLIICSCPCSMASELGPYEDVTIFMVQYA